MAPGTAADSSYTGFYIAILGVVLSTMTGIVCYFIKRYIDSNDTHHKGVDEKLSLLKTDLSTHKDGMVAHQKEMSGIAVQIERSAVKFQSEVNSELLKLHKTSTEISSDMNMVKKDVKELHTVVEAHQKSLSMGAQALVKQREEMNDIKTKVTKLSENATLYGTEKKKSDKA